MVVSGPSNIRSFVDKQTGTIDREIFVSDEIYQQELKRVFARSWLFVGHVSQIPNPNDFFVSRMGEESVILTRDRQGEIHVLLNTCRHRGMKVCRYDEGNTPVFSCPYHGWSYSTDGNLVSVPGELIGVPQFATAYHGELEKEQWGLIAVPKMHVYKGSVWACWDENAPEWNEYMGGMEKFLDQLFDSTDGQDGKRLVVAGVQKWIMPCNWKWGAENFIGDAYHGTPSHRSANLAGRFPGRHQVQSGSLRAGGANQNLVDRVSLSFKGGHGVLGANPSELWDVEVPHFSYEDSQVDRFFQDAHEAKQRRLRGRGPGRSNSPLTVFPNMSSGGGWSSVAVWHPAGPRHTETWRWYFVDEDVPGDIRELWRSEQITFSGPSGLVEEDDMENWNYASEASNGVIARRFPYNYAQGQGRAERDEALPGVQVSRQPTSEENARGLYWRWAEMMDAESWDQLREWDRAKD